MPSGGRLGEISLRLRRRFGLVALLPFLVGHAVDDLARRILAKGNAVSAAASWYQLDRQLRQNPARFMRSMFCTSVRSRKCATSRRNAAASSCVAVA